MASVRDLNISKLTVKKLTKLAKERGLEGYSKKNKSELLRLLEAQENSLDQPVPVNRAIVKVFSRRRSNQSYFQPSSSCRHTSLCSRHVR